MFNICVQQISTLNIYVAILFQLKNVKTKRISPSGRPQAALSLPYLILQGLRTAPNLHPQLPPTAPNQPRPPQARHRGYVTHVFKDVVLTYVMFINSVLSSNPARIHQTGLVGLVDYPDDEDEKEESDEEEQSPRKRPRLGL